MSRLSQMLASELKRREKSERELAREFGWSQQAFNTWLKGSVPRQQFYARIAKFLQVNIDDVEMLAKEAVESNDTTKLPYLGAPLLGRGTADSVTLDKFPIGYAKPEIEDCYALRVDGRILWINPKITPAAGNMVILRADGQGRVAQWPTEHDGEVHVVVLAEMI
ncbi:helix-turn-helix transcriptional regulator [Sinorhizobium sp. 7-81]|uniref:helix-turn-helix domain-containing protein n=1 Tax=Sinorhizobium sp. 8-89 TaxID=3049089 RepID=UPI0024C3F148|nr:helix-turn-helix transcriptional regulator [Sinorhizobium sp. 8-89]MDK1489360.1 helix-turn-helix transcriptional regulator [Sinorhizobium sp. 8-89]